MSKVIFDTETKQKITIRTALDRGIAKNPKRFNLPKNKVLIPSGKTKKLITPYQASILVKKGELQINKIIGDFDLEVDEKSIIKNNQLGKREQSRIIKENKNNNIIRHILTPTEKTSSYALYDFLKNNNIRGRGTIICSQDGYVLFDEELNITDPFSKWWKDKNGWLIGMINSTFHAWVSQTSNKGYNETYYMLNRMGDKKYNIKPKTRITREYKDGDVSLNHMGKIKNIFNNTRTVFMWVPRQNINAEKYYQTYRENKTNSCFFDGVERYMINNDRKESKAILNKLQSFKDLYNNGVPEKDLQLVCDQLKINVEINDVFNSNYISIEGKKSRNNKIRFINTYLNHLDENKFIDNNINEDVETFKEMRKIIKQCIINNEYFYYKGTQNEPNKIFTKDKIYIHKNKLNDIIKDFNNEIDINNYSINIKEDDKLYDFLKQGVNYNAHCAFNKLHTLDNRVIEKDKRYTEYDMKSAYAQYKNCKYYIGFPNMMTPEIQLENWTVKKCKKYIGYYKIYLRHIQDENKRNIMSELGFDNNKYYVLTSPEILFYSTFCDFDIISGSYSFKSLDIDMTEEMKEKIEIEKYRKNITVKPYAIWTGKLNAVHTHSTMKTNISKELAETISENYNHMSYIDTRDINDELKKDEVYNNDDLIECIVSNENKNIYWLGHIGGFITAYTRINVIEQLLKFKHKQIVGFKLDGFIIEKSKDDTIINNMLDNDIWYDAGEKPTKCDFAWGFKIYEPCSSLNSIFVKSKSEYHDQLFNNRVSYLIGAGGTGKSHSVLDKLKDTIYLTACWSLCVGKSNEYNIKSMSVHQFIGIGCESYLDTHKPPKRILIDEITMIDKKYIKQIIKKCPYSQIFIAGDIDEYGYYQCAFKDVEVIKPTTKETIIFTKNYRCKDNILLQRLNDLRKYMKDTKFHNKKILDYVKNNFNDRIIDEQYLIDTYDYKKDWILVSVTNGEKSQTDYYSKLLKGKKYICKTHTKDDVHRRLNDIDAYLNGDIAYDIQPSKRFIQQDAFTIHGFQGKTIKNPERLFIDLKHIFCSRQLYTALSRVECLNQIYLIN